jgi:hypothetical protein
MANHALLIAAGAAAVAGVAVLRLAWSRPKRSAWLNGGGWGLIALAAALAGAHSGAWGISVAALCGMGAALLALTHAAAGDGASAGGKVSNRRVGMLPEGREPLRIGRRFATFLIVAPVAMIVSAGIAVPVRALALLAGAGEADANVIGLFAMPLAWTVLAHVLLMKESRAAQVRVLLIWAAIGIIGSVAELIA